MNNISVSIPAKTLGSDDVSLLIGRGLSTDTIRLSPHDGESFEVNIVDIVNAIKAISYYENITLEGDIS